MGKRITTTGPADRDTLDAVTARLRRSAARYPAVSQSHRNPAAGWLAALQAGRPVDVPALSVHGLPGVTGGDRYRVDPDGRISPAPVPAG